LDITDFLDLSPKVCYNEVLMYMIILMNMLVHTVKLSYSLLFAFSIVLCTRLVIWWVFFAPKSTFSISAQQHGMTYWLNISLSLSAFRKLVKTVLFSDGLPRILAVVHDNLVLYKYS